MNDVNPFCCEHGCTWYGLNTLGGKLYCDFHFREIRNAAGCAMHQMNDATVDDETAELIQARMERDARMV